MQLMMQIVIQLVILDTCGTSSDSEMVDTVKKRKNNSDKEIMISEFVMNITYIPLPRANEYSFVFQKVVCLSLMA